MSNYIKDRAKAFHTKVVWVVENEYFYSPHHKYPGIYELYAIDERGMEKGVQNFCLIESAVQLAREDRAWKEKNFTITNETSVTRATRKPAVVNTEEGITDAKKEARRAKRQKRKEAKQAMEK